MENQRNGLQDKLPVRNLVRIIRVLMAAMIPFLLILLSVRILLASATFFAAWEYQRSVFPEDPYGFNVDDRIYWSEVDIRFLQNSSLELSYFDGYELENGEPMHNERELQHMQDVKILSEAFWLAGRVLILLFVILAAMMWNLDTPESIGKILSSGARFTFILIGVVFTAVLVGFNTFFVGFHKIFFTGDTWLFKYSDTFIRLYPEMFWQDIFIVLAVLTALLAVGFGAAGWGILRASRTGASLNSDEYEK